MVQHIALLTVVTALSTAAPGDWPGWRGPGGTGISPEKELPLRWGPTENVRWRVPLPGPGNSSPIVWGERVFITQAVKEEKRRTVMCFDRADGKLLWQSGVTYSEDEPSSRDNPYCAATPVTDGERVIASFGSAGLYCYDFGGKELWHRDLGKMSHMFGNASSPVLAGDLCILNFGPDEKARLIAVQKRTGQTAWEVEPPKVDPSEMQGPGGFAGPGGRGRGGFGPGMFIAPQMVSQADKDGDGRATKEEFSALAEAWFDKLDPGKAGKLSGEQFAERFGDLVPPPQGFGPPGGGPGEEGKRAGGGRRGFNPGRFAAPGFFSAADGDKDGALTREEWKADFAKWFDEWDRDKKGSLDEAKLREGLDAALPPPQFGGPGGPGGRGPGGPGGMGGGATWSTPMVVAAEGHDELVMSFPHRLAAYDPKTGKGLWWSKGIGGDIYTTPLWGDGVLAAMSSGMGGGSAIAVKPGGSGDVSEGRRAWRLERVKSCIGSGAIDAGHLYTISQDGFAACLDLGTGKTVWEQRLSSPSGRNASWSSLLVAGGKIYAPNQAGDVTVLSAGPKFEVLAVNSLGESTNASLAASRGELFLRTNKSLWCISTGR